MLIWLSMINTRFCSCYINKKILIDSRSLFRDWITFLMEIQITVFDNIELRLRKKQNSFSFKSTGPSYLNPKRKIQVQLKISIIIVLYSLTLDNTNP